MLSNRKILYILRVSIDLIILLISYFTAFFLTAAQHNLVLTSNEVVPIFILILIWYFSARSFSLYDDFRIRSFISEIIAVIKNILVQSIALIILLFLIKHSGLSRFFVFVYIATLGILIITEKFLLYKFIHYIRLHGRNIRQMLIIGAGEVGKRFYNSIKTNPRLGYKVVGFLDDNPQSMNNGMYLGNLDDLTKILDEEPIDDVVIALPPRAAKKMENLVHTCEQYTTRIRIIPDYFSMISSKYSFSLFNTFPIITVREDKLSQIQWRILKRGFDTAFSLFLFLLVFSWLWPIIAISIKISSKGPVFFKQERAGRGNRPFYAYKFRSMVVESKDVDNNGKYRQATKNDPRITPIGAFLRKTNLDELPQFWNVLKGEMSIVGPRPHPKPLDYESRKIVNLYMQRNLVKPGITGWAQVNGLRGETSKPGLMQKRIDHDIWYIENWSFWLDIQIIFLTIWNMIKGEENAY